MKPRDTIQVLAFIDKLKKRIRTEDKDFLGYVRGLASKDEDISKEDADRLMRIYCRLTDCKRLKWGSAVRP